MAARSSQKVRASESASWLAKSASPSVVTIASEQSSGTSVKGLLQIIAAESASPDVFELHTASDGLLDLAGRGDHLVTAHQGRNAHDGGDWFGHPPAGA